MTYVPPTPYVRASRFSQFGTAIPGTVADVELDDVKLATDSLAAALAVLQRNDGALNNKIVTPDSFSLASVLLLGGWNPRGGWVTARAYAVRDMVEQPVGSGNIYVCVVGHTSGTFATDLAAVDWTLLSGPVSSVAAGTTGQLAAYLANGNAISGVTAIPNGITATTQAATDASTLIATMAALATATGKVKIQTFDIGGGTSQTYTPSAGMVNALAFGWGGGGAGGSTINQSSAGAMCTGAGGGAGGWAIKLMTAAAVGVSKAIVLGVAGVAAATGNNAGGAGGDTTIGGGSLLIARGGFGGGGSNNTTAAGGAGGGTSSANVGDVTGTGMPGNSFPVVALFTGGAAVNGGSSLIGGGGQSSIVNGIGTGGAATGRAAGGAGGYSYNNAGAAAGGAGSAGHVFIIEFCNQG